MNHCRNNIESIMIQLNYVESLLISMLFQQPVKREEMKKEELPKNTLKVCIFIHFNSFTSKKQTTKFLSANFKKNLSSSYIRLVGKQYCEPPHQDPYCLQIQLVSLLVVKELRHVGTPPNCTWFMHFSTIFFQRETAS